MNRILMAIISLLATLFLPALIKTPAGEPFLAINDHKALLYTITYTRPYHEWLKQLSALLATSKEKEVTEVFVWQDHQGNLHFSDKSQSRPGQTAYQIENQHAGRLAFPPHWVTGLMLAVWLTIYLLLHAPMHLIRYCLNKPPEKKQALKSGLNIQLDTPQQENLSSTNDTPYQILGVSENASADEIKTAYRNKIRQYHPDRVAHLGKELQMVARRKSTEINKAYQSLRIK